MTRLYPLLVLGGLHLASCGESGQEKTSTEDEMAETGINILAEEPLGLEIQGHRGCRGLLPENTIPGFVLAIRQGVDVLEMDLCISGDGKVMVSHEPWMNHEMCSKPDGSPIAEKEERKHNIYAMTVDEIQTYDCGLKPHPRFPDQRNLPAHKPTLAEVVSVVETIPVLDGHGPIRYNLEIKHSMELETAHCPGAQRFSEVVLEEVQRLGIAERTCIQSFSPPVMEAIHNLSPGMTTAWLVGTEGTPEDQLARLSFVPDIYSPNWKLIDENDVSRLQAKGIRVIPWTVNETEDLESVMALGVDGIITDYPDRLGALRPKGAN